MTLLRAALAALLIVLALYAWLLLRPITVKVRWP